MKRILLLENKKFFVGEAFGYNFKHNEIDDDCYYSDPTVLGKDTKISKTFEVVFTTAMSGYVESITDQSYNSQAICFTYPMIGNYGVSPHQAESVNPTTAGVIVREYAKLGSNHTSKMSIDEFLISKKIPGISNVDTRALTRILRNSGVMNGLFIDVPSEIAQKLEGLDTIETLEILGIHGYDIEWELPNNQVAQVSTKTPYNSPGEGKNIVVIDFGLKLSILRELSSRGCNISVLPYTSTFEEIMSLDPNGVLLSNGPGDPETVASTTDILEIIRKLQQKVPVFGICLGHQLFSLANGAKTEKLKFGHRGLNHPVKEIESGKVAFTSQNHGYAVSADSIKDSNLIVTHIELNDNSIEGVRHNKYSAFSVQFHPDATPGPTDFSKLFDQFLDSIDEAAKSNDIRVQNLEPEVAKQENLKQAKEIKKVLVIGSGPIIIGQAAEFDYAGTQACLALKEEGIEVILVNSNPATIMTDPNIADKVYIEPITIEFVSKILRKELPDAILPTIGGQVGLNMALELEKHGILDELGISVLGTGLNSIKKAEDRDEFKQLMEEIGEPIPESEIVNTVQEAVDYANSISYPVIVRPAFTLGGTGGGMCDNEEKLREIVDNGLRLSPVTQCLIEKSIAGFKEIEYEVMRDKKGTKLVVCNMENFDPVGIHTGDSIVFAPTQTLTDQEHQMLRNASLKIIEALKIEGGCNVQLALDTASSKYYIIEVNPRVSRSSALASKATGYPIARLAAKIAIGKTLDEIMNPVTKTTYSSFEPSLDYVVAKIPRFPFDKFDKADKKLSTQMKATGEVMAIGRNIEESLLKAYRSLELGNQKELPNLGKDEILEIISKGTSDRLDWILKAIRENVSIYEIREVSNIDIFYLNKLENIVGMEKVLRDNPMDIKSIKNAKLIGFSDADIAKLSNKKETEIREFRKVNNICPVYKMVDTCSSEFESSTNYLYSTYGQEDEVNKESKKESILVIGSGPIRIGQGVEFDYATVHSVQAVREMGLDAIVMNSNPETVSTDYSISDKLYFEPLTFEDVMNVIDKEKPKGVIVQFGGQTAINLTSKLEKAGVNILGSSSETLDKAEDRKLFDKVLTKLNIPRPLGETALNFEDAKKIAKAVGYPVLVRPSFVLGGRAMKIVKSEKDLEVYIKDAVLAMPGQPILIDHYISGKECELDAICDSKDIFIPGIMEHIERAGVHSGDSIAIYPTISLSKDVKQKIIDYTRSLALELGIIGIMNIQFIVENEEVYIIEVNPRASRTVPFLSKITKVFMANIATKVILGKTIKELNLEYGLLNEPSIYSVKAPVFSFSKLGSVDTNLGPEMKSTGEVMGTDTTVEKAFYKAFEAVDMHIKSYGSILFTICDADKEESLPLAKRFRKLGYRILATKSTAAFFRENNIEVQEVGRVEHDGKISDDPNDIVNIIQGRRIQAIINMVDQDHKYAASDGFIIRRAAVESGVPLFTSLDTASAILSVLEMNGFLIESI